MLNANEVRIGNWVRISEGIAPYSHEYRVTAILEFGNRIVVNHGHIDTDAYYGIQLTTEVLELAGFEMLHKPLHEETLHGVIKGLGGDFRYKDFILVAGHHEWWYWGAPLNTRIDYVHQLQNLYYALTNEELKIDL